MPAQILATKFYLPPPGAGIISRPRLFTLLENGLQRKLTLVSAPPGYGKTTLLSAWIASRQGENLGAGPSVHFGWLTLDSGDNDPQRFLIYLAAAIQATKTDDRRPTTGNQREFPQGQNLAEIEASLSQLLNHLAQARAHIALVLDDFYLVQEEQVHSLLTSLIEQMPATCHIYLATRTDPALPLARLRVGRQLVEVRGDDLRFTISEATEMLHRSAGLELSREDIALLVARTEGWAAGLQLAGLSLQNQPDTAGFIARFSGTDRYIFEYLMAEVLSRQSDQMREFLLRTSILDQLCAPLCQVLVDSSPGATPAAEILAYLEKANLFLVPLGNDRTWYRYHQLFAELLRAGLQQAWPAEVPALHLRASRWYEAQGSVTEAIHHALAGGDVARVTHLIANNVLALLEHGELNALLRQLQAMPEEPTACRPWLCIARAWAMAYAGQLLGVEPLLRSVEQSLEEGEPAQVDTAAPTPGSDYQLRGHIAAIRAYVEWIQGNFECAIDLAWQADGYLPDDEPAAQAINLTTLGISLQYCGQLQQAAQVLARATRLSREAQETHATLLAGAGLAYVQWLLGDLQQAMQICRDLLELAGQYAHRSGMLIPATCSVYAIQSAIHCEWNDLESALQEARLGLALSLEWGQADNLVVNYLYLSRILSASGDMAAAKEALSQGQQVAGQVSLWFHDLVDTYGAELHLTCGELEEAAAWSIEHRLSPNDPISYQRESEYRVLAWLLIEQGRADEALPVLGRVLAALEPSGAIRSLVRTRLLQALAHQAQGQPQQALSSLQVALALGKEGEFVRSFVELGEPMLGLLKELQARINATHGNGGDQVQLKAGYLARILTAFAGGQNQTLPPVAEHYVEKPPTGALPAATLFNAGMEPLSEREMDVLRFLAGHLTVPEIAQTMYLSPYTVRSHVKSIYAKLDAHNRSQAVQRARALHLI